jgi:hypothetical protein
MSEHVRVKSRQHGSRWYVSAFCPRKDCHVQRNANGALREPTEEQARRLIRSHIENAHG